MEQNNLRFIPAVLSQTGKIYGEFKILVKEQIRHKLILISFEREAKSSKVRSVLSAMKWWSKCISMAVTITKTASTSRNVAFEVAMMRESITIIMESRDELIKYVSRTVRRK